MRIPSRGTPDFWRLYHRLPGEVRATARKNYALWRANAFHPSLHFKTIGATNWSARVGGNYRAIGRFIGHEFVWEWIGSHADYDNRFCFRPNLLRMRLRQEKNPPANGPSRFRFAPWHVAS